MKRGRAPKPVNRRAPGGTGVTVSDFTAVADQETLPKSLKKAARTPTDLRWRFGTIMAVALSPLLLFSIWQSASDYRAATERARTLTTTAGDVVGLGVSNVLAEADATLGVLLEGMSTGDCGDTLDTAVEETEAIDAVVLMDARGAVACQSGPPLPRDGIARAIAAVEAGMEPATVYAKPDDMPRGRHIVARGEGDTLIAAGLDWGRLWDAYAQIKADLEADAALLDVDGAVLFSSRADFPITNMEGLAELDIAGEARKIARTSDGRRVVVVRPTPIAGLYSAVSRPQPSFLGWQRLNILSGSLIPVLAWLFAFGAIWFAADRLILMHLRRLREAALHFAGGDMERRIGRLPEAPAQIQQLGDTFDLMATRIGEREARLTTSLEEKSVLLREIHHRVKNNLQIIISLLNMQARDLDEPKGLAAIEDARNRVGAIALVHRSLYESDDLAEVDMQPFLETLVTDLFRSLGAQARGCRLHTDLAAAEFDPEKAIPLALFVVEGLSNAIKHGCPKGGDVWVGFTHVDDSTDAEEGANSRILSIRDSGPGMVEGSTTSTGWRLMRGFARQLGGALETDATGDGFEVRIRF